MGVLCYSSALKSEVVNDEVGVCTRFFIPRKGAFGTDNQTIEQLNI